MIKGEKSINGTFETEQPAGDWNKPLLLQRRKKGKVNFPISGKVSLKHDGFENSANNFFLCLFLFLFFFDFNFSVAEILVFVIYLNISKAPVSVTPDAKEMQ